MAASDECDTRILKAEIRRLRERLNRLTPSLSVMLRRRGFAVHKKEPPDDLLLPDTQFIDSYFQMLKKYSFRLFLRDVIKNQPLFTLAQATRFATKEVTAGYVDYLLAIGVIKPEGGEFRLIKGPIKNFGTTLEWFVAEIFRRELSAEAIWGVKIKHRTVGGDYDLLSKIEGSILYMEIKSSPPKQIYQNEITAFVNRIQDLKPGVAIFFMDTELRMKDKIVPMFEEELKDRFAEPPEVKRMERELFEITGEPGVPDIFIINAKDSIVTNIERVLARHFRGKT